MRIAFLYPNDPIFHLSSHEEQGLGGSENGLLATIRYVLNLGHQVDVFNKWPFGIDNGRLRWDNIKQFNPRQRYDVVFSLRHSEVFEAYDEETRANAGLTVLFLADTESHGLGDRVRRGLIDVVMAVSNWQKAKIAREEEITNDHWIVTSNGVERDQQQDVSQRIRNRCLFIATPERGLTNLLTIWPSIRQKVPDASLELFSSFQGWGTPAHENAERLKPEYTMAESMARLGVINSVHGNAERIRQAQREAEFYLYPTNFSETCCMSVLESMHHGVIPITTAKAALLEKVIPHVTGFTVPDYTAESDRYRGMFGAVTVGAMGLPDNQRLVLSTNCRRYAEQYTYDMLVPRWINEWQRRLHDKRWQWESVA